MEGWLNIYERVGEIWTVDTVIDKASPFDDTCLMTFRNVTILLNIYHNISFLFLYIAFYFSNFDIISFNIKNI